ncbi:type II secretion system inner membrane protein GspF [Bordetella genomosp. 11]|uniref:Type II secretion system protein GspF n=1 Tax=Bordetella genomosp. 11 TaxID=1416808 RepID=A0A261UMI4_9BORD|nr:type II secretion system inner membrane protein GspF [Bordetella genomosp. 11]OZI63089.1 type II secretion system protein GspF [Bordetella genomosp. 11]
MPSYTFEASDAAGHLERGMIDADSPRGARNALRARGLTPLSVRDASGHHRAGSARWLGKHLGDTELAWLTRQIASLLAARLPLDAALTATLEQAEKRHVAQALSAVRADVRAGHRLADALASRPKDFPDIYRALVAAGEESGDLSLVMERLATYVEQRNALRGKVLTAFIYPAIVGVVSVGIIFFLLGFVVPQVIGAFNQTHQQLPLITRIMVAMSDIVRDWGAAGLAAGGAAFAAWRWSLRAPPARLRWHARALRLPMAGRFILEMNAARFASTLAILTGSGVSLLRALQAAAQTLTNDRLRAAVADATDRVRQGAALAASLQTQKAFPPLLIHLIGSGERTGELAPMLDRAATTLSADLERRAMAMTALLEPLMILIMGGVVLVIVLAVMMPIIEINQMVQ